MCEDMAGGKGGKHITIAIVMPPSLGGGQGMMPEVHDLGGGEPAPMGDDLDMAPAPADLGGEMEMADEEPMASPKPPKMPRPMTSKKPMASSRRFA